MFLLVHMTALAVVLFATHHYARRSLGFALVVFGVVPLVLTPHWLRVVHQDWFAWAKLYSVIAGAVWLLGLCLTRLGGKRWARQLFLAILFVNIVEAVVKDLTKGSLANGVDACAGVLLLVSLVRGNRIEITRDQPITEMLWHGVSRGWIVGYTLWNATFVYLNLPFLISSHVIVLLVPMLVGLKWPERWLEARVHTLGMVLLLQFTFGSYFKGPLVNSAHWYDASVGLAAALLSLGVVSGSLAWSAVGRRLASSARQAPATG